MDHKESHASAVSAREQRISLYKSNQEVEEEREPPAFDNLAQVQKGSTLWYKSRRSKTKGKTYQVRRTGKLLSVKPVLNWKNVCSPNILRTVRRTMIRFLIELLVRRTLLRS